MNSMPTPDSRTRFSSRRTSQVEFESFPELDEESLGLLKSAGEVITPKDGETLIKAGDAYDLYLVLAGGISLVDRREERVSFVVEAGDFVGELGMLMAQPAFLAGVAMPQSKVLRVTIPDLRRLMATSNTLSDLILSALDARRRMLGRLGEGGLVLAGDDDRDLHRLREYAERNYLPYRTVLRSDASAWAELVGASALPDEGTAVVTGQGDVLAQPTTRDLASAVGLDVSGLTGEAECDLLVVGAGPAGLAAAVYGASEGLDVILVEDFALGGQAGTSSRIENYLGFPRGISGGELARSAMLQAVKFGARLVSPRSVTGLSREKGSFRVRLDDETDVAAHSVVVATGVQYRRLEVPGIAEFESQGVYYAATELEARACMGKDVVIVGGANSAGQAALFLAQHAERVHVLIRRADLTETMSSYLAQRLSHHDRITVHPRTHLTSVTGDRRIAMVSWHDESSQEEVSIEAGGLFLMIGAVPRTDWLNDAGVELDTKGFVRTGAGFTTSVPGIFAVGDVRADSVKRVASAVGEGSVVVSAVLSWLGDQQK